MGVLGDPATSVSLALNKVATFTLGACSTNLDASQNSEVVANWFEDTIVTAGL